MRRIIDQSHDKSILIQLLAVFFERASYYGFRAILVLYMIDETRKLTFPEAANLFSWLTIALLFSRIAGGLLGDFALGNRRSILLGGIFQGIGIFTICLPFTFPFYFGLILLILGNGLYDSNLVAQFGKRYVAKSQLLDASFTMYHFACNLGAFVGILLIGYLGETVSWELGFIVSGFFTLIGAVLILLFDHTLEIFRTPPKKKSSKGGVYLLIGIFCLFIYWFVEMQLIVPVEELRTHYYKEDFSFYQIVFSSPEAPIIGLIFYLLFIFLWSRYYLSQFIKLLIAFLLFACIIGMLVWLLKHLNEGFPLFAIVIILYTLTSLLIKPIIYALLVKYVNTKYLTTAMSLYFVPGSLAALSLLTISEQIEPSIDNYTQLILLLVFTSLGLGVFLILDNAKKRDGSSK